MTTEEWWQEIEKYTLAGDWNGLLVCADGLQELGCEPEAAGIRWWHKKDWLPFPTFCDQQCTVVGFWNAAYIKNSEIVSLANKGCRDVWEWVAMRKWIEKE